MLLLYGSVGEVEVFGDYSILILFLLYQRTTTVDRLLTLDQRTARSKLSPVATFDLNRKTFAVHLKTISAGKGEVVITKNGTLTPMS